MFVSGLKVVVSLIARLLFCPFFVCLGFWFADIFLVVWFVVYLDEHIFCNLLNNGAFLVGGYVLVCYGFVRTAIGVMFIVFADCLNV